MRTVSGGASIRSLGGARLTRLLLLVFICDVSGSMAGASIEALNFAMEAVVKLLLERKRERRGFDLRVLGVAFGERPRIVIPTTSIDNVCFTSLVAADGDTRIGPAFELVAQEYDRVKDELGVSPVELVVTDGQVKDDWKPALQRLTATVYGSKARRLAVPIGMNADRDMLLEYLGGEGKLLPVDKPEEIVKAIVENVTESVSGVIQSFSQGGLNLASGNFPLLRSCDDR